MAAPKNNKFWELRSKHGRDKIFKDPKSMLDACYEYFEHQSNQKWERTDFKGKEVEMVKIPTASPFSLTGLCIFLGVNTKYFNQFEITLDTSTEEGKGFSNIIAHVRDIIFNQQFEGATTGAYNASIIARKLGLTDKKELKGSLDITQITGTEIK